MISQTQTSSWADLAPFILVRYIGDVRYYWTHTKWSAWYWDAQHYVSADVAYRAAVRECWPAEVERID